MKRELGVSCSSEVMAPDRELAFGDIGSLSCTAAPPLCASIFTSHVPLMLLFLVQVLEICVFGIRETFPALYPSTSVSGVMLATYTCDEKRPGTSE